MDVNLSKGQVNIISNDFLNNTSQEITLQITDTLAMKCELDKIDASAVNVSIINTLFSDVEQKGKVSKSDIEKMIKMLKNMFVQLM